jgi:hypothetical protein
VNFHLQDVQGFHFSAFSPINLCGTDSKLSFFVTLYRSRSDFTAIETSQKVKKQITLTNNILLYYYYGSGINDPRVS